MKRIAIAWLAGVVLVMLTPGAVAAGAADDLPKAETILDKYVDATGGAAAYDGHHNEIITGTMEMASAHLKGKLTSYHAAPVKMYMEIDMEGVGKMQDGTDGTVAWSLSAVQGPHLKDGDEKAMALRTARFASGLSANDFLRRTSVISYTQQALEATANDVRVLAEREGLTAHWASVDIRRPK